ncbi:glycosyltransferase [Paenibacillus sp. FSL M7-0420]|uniref:glycosyltransferase n=1 Tax=Paenibacillus sp. FSL M7-0420 TaxID=2921609 RepID=UPI0030F5230D
MKTSIIVLTYNQLDYTKMCIESIRKYTTAGSYEIIVVDNGSTDGTRGWIESQKDLRFLFNEVNFGFPYGCNQGIDLAIGENILFLNNDTIVTQKWLDNMLFCLMSSDEYGAVSCVTNNISYGQAIPTNYKTIEEMHHFAYSYNKQNLKLWEERLKLVGFCLLVKASVIKKIGKMDEIFSPGNFEDDDYSLRIRKAGYRLILCKDTFIHHFGSVSFKQTTDFNHVLFNNMNKYQKKWGFNPISAQNIRFDIIEMMDLSEKEELNILEVGCGCGGTLLKVKNENNRCNVYGVELNAAAAEVASLVAKVDIFDSKLRYPNNFFDYIILTNCFDFNVGEVIPQFMNSLKPSGCLLADFKNMMYYDVIKKILNGSWTAKDGSYSLIEINRLLKQSGFDALKIQGIKSDVDQSAEWFIDKVISITGIENKNELCTTHYLVSAVKSELFEIVKSIKVEKDDQEELINKLSTYSVENIIKNISFAFYNDEEVRLLTFLGVIHFEHGLHEKVLPFFERAYSIEKYNKEVIYNLSYYYLFFGEKDKFQSHMVYLKNLDNQLHDELSRISNEFIS